MPAKVPLGIKVVFNGMCHEEMCESDPSCETLEEGCEGDDDRFSAEPQSENGVRQIVPVDDDSC